MISSNIHRFAKRFGSWGPFSGKTKSQQRLIVWWSIAGHSSASNASYLLVPLAYRLEGTRLVVDFQKTREGIARFGDIYRDIAKESGNRFQDLHRAAGQAFKALASGN